ncbi:hypothetical protein [Xanthobacter tagetidis]|uniref:hypothetical protein n=1 Tax=Xanthobacter tagetidis TaxID=60216 RepID=UPI001475778B|nr:hypothetical protein [Xanthobacter tagetidis]MBB6306156.1 hypothetical protein [Xanthobacter tagetidis]
MTQVPTPSAAPAVPGVISIRLTHVSQLFNMLDPFPFRERDLAPEAEEYIAGWAEEMPARAPLAIVVHLPEAEAAGPDAQGLPEAIAHFFDYRRHETARELAQLFRVGRLSLVIGLGVLAVCLVAAQLVGHVLGEGTFAGILEESLVIVGWVANWRPIEIFLYEWWPLARRRDLFARLAAARVEVRAEGAAGSADARGVPS